jgi:hypothetical protein
MPSHQVVCTLYLPLHAACLTLWNLNFEPGKFSSYLKEKITLLHYMDQLVNTVYSGNHINTLINILCWQNEKFLTINIKVGAICSYHWVLKGWYCWKWARLYKCGTRPVTDPMSIPQMTCEWIWGSDGMILSGENRRTRGKKARCYFVHHRSYMGWPGPEFGPLR